MPDLSNTHAAASLVVLFGIFLFWITSPFIVGFTAEGFTAEILDKKETWNSGGDPRYYLTIQTIDEVKDIKISVEEFNSGKYEIGSNYIQIDTFDGGKLTFMILITSALYVITFFGGFLIFPKKKYVGQY